MLKRIVTTIFYPKENSVQIVDPNGIFSDIQLIQRSSHDFYLRLIC